MSSHQPDPGFMARVAGNYERYFVPAIGAPVAEDLMRTAALRPGERVLDVACGTGVATRCAARQVGPDGRVTGLDVSPAMLAVARSSTPPELDIEWCDADAAAMPLSDQAFDAVLCQLGLQLMPQRLRALREMRRVLAPDGRVAINVPGEEGPVFQALAAALERHVGTAAGGFVHQVFSLKDADAVRTLMHEADFEDVNVSVHAVPLNLPAPREFLWQYVESTPLAGALASASVDVREAIERDVVATCPPQDGERSGRAQPIVSATARRGDGGD